MTDVFISYKKEDVARVEPIARGLAQAGYDVWWDHRIPPGRSYREVIGAALQSAKCVIVVWSSLSANAQWVLDEADTGKQRNVLLPLMIDEVEIPYGFRQIEAARLIGWRGDAADPEWKSALEAVAHFVGRPPGGPPKPFRTPSAGAPAPRAERKAPDAPRRGGGAGGIVIGALVLLALAGVGGFFVWRADTIGPPSQLGTQTTPIEAPATAATPTITAIKVDSADSSGFRRLSDGAWVEMAPDGQPRFRFTEETRDGDVLTLVDETRNMRLRIEPGARAVSVEASGAWRPLYGIAAADAPAPPVSAREDGAPSTGVTRVWFASGGALLRQADASWVETDPQSGAPNGFAWRESARSADTIVLRDEARGASARIAFTENTVYLTFPDWGEWRPQWRIRALDYEP